jgi:hypothetical protein
MVRLSNAFNAFMVPATAGVLSAVLTFGLLLGYYNRNRDQIVDIPVGPNNRIEGGGADGGDLGQPTHFLPGRGWGLFAVKVPADFGDNRRTNEFLSFIGRLLFKCPARDQAGIARPRPHQVYFTSLHPFLPHSEFPTPLSSASAPPGPRPASPVRTPPLKPMHLVAAIAVWLVVVLLLFSSFFTNRAGLLGQGSLLTVTSYPSRTSAVQRGKYILTNIMGTPHMPHREWLRLQNYVKKLPDLFRRTESLEKKLTQEEQK